MLQDVDGRLTQLPVRPIHGQNPRVAGKTQQIGDHARGRAVQFDMLEKSIEPLARGIRLRRARMIKSASQASVARLVSDSLI